jgi:SPP1 family phage portal protein
MSDIKLAVDTLADRQDVYTNAMDYYQGSEAEVFANVRWGSLFRSTGLDYVLNFSKTVVDTVLDRLEIASITGIGDEAAATIDKIWERNELELDANEIHRKALVYGECYAIVWPDDEGEVQITYNAPTTTVLLYDEESPRVKKVAGKVWQSVNVFGKKIVRLNLYYADRVEKFWRDGEVSLISGDENSWHHTETVENPFGEIPVFHFRTHRPYGTPEHAAALGAQDAINKLVSNHMTTVDYLGAPQRYALSGADSTGEAEDFDNDDTSRENINSLHNNPGTVWFMKGINQVGQFPAADSKHFLDPIMAYVKWMASLTSTPLHYFHNNGQFASGEALRNSESALTKKVRDRQRSFGATWRELFRFALRVEGIVTDIQVKWAGVESIDSTDMWNIAMVKKNIGIPLKIILMDMGYDEEIAQEIADEAEAAKAAATPQTGGQLGLGMNTHNLALQAQKQEQAPVEGE